MVKRASYTQAQRDEALEHYRTHGPTAVEKKLGIPKGTVYNWAKKAGIATVATSKTRHATEARSVDLAARRAQISTDLLEKYAFVMRKLDKQTQTVSAGQVVTTMEPTPEALQRLVTTAGILLDKHMALVKLDNDNGAAAAKSMMQKLAEQIGVADE